MQRKKSSENNNASRQRQTPKAPKVKSAGKKSTPKPTRSAKKREAETVEPQISEKPTKKRSPRTGAGSTQKSLSGSPQKVTRKKTEKKEETPGKVKKTTSSTKRAVQKTVATSKTAPTKQTGMARTRKSSATTDSRRPVRKIQAADEFTATISDTSLNNHITGQHHPAKTEMQTSFIRSIRNLPRQYNMTFIKAIAKDPHCLYVFWEVGTKELDEALQHHSLTGSGEKHPIQWILRVKETGKASEQAALTIPVDSVQQQTYIPTLKADSTYTVSYGFKDTKGTFHPMIHSNEVTMPSDTISSRVDETWVSPSGFLRTFTPDEEKQPRHQEAVEENKEELRPTAVDTKRPRSSITKAARHTIIESAACHPEWPSTIEMQVVPGLYPALPLFKGSSEHCMASRAVSS